MKNSKIDHTMMAVAKTVREGRVSGVSGIIYENPQKRRSQEKITKRKKNLYKDAKAVYDELAKDVDEEEKKEILEIVEYVSGRVKKVQECFSVWNAEEEFAFVQNEEEKKFCETVKENFAVLAGALMRKSDIRDQKKFLQNLPSEKFYDRRQREQRTGGCLGVNTRVSEGRCKELIASLVTINIRKSYQKECKVDKEDGKMEKVFLPDVAAKLVWAMCNGGSTVEYQEEYKKIVSWELTTFLEELKEQYFKKTQLAHMIKSIIKQEVKVQARQAGDGMAKLQLSNAGHRRKQYIFKFIQEFSSANKKEQDEMFCYIKKLMLLFYCGSDLYEQTEQDYMEVVLGWGFSFQGDIAKDLCYSDEIRELVTKYNLGKAGGAKQDPEQKKLYLLIKKKTKEKINESYKLANAYLMQKYLHMTDREEAAVSEENREEYEKASYWLSFIQEKTKQYLLDNGKVFRGGENDSEKEQERKKPNSLSVKVLCEYAWNEWLSFICEKYIDMGKAVYHFAMPDLGQVGGKEAMVIGEVLPQFRNGLTSFDYERIKAYDDFDRKISTYVTFAVENFARAVLIKEKRQEKKSEDVLDKDKMSKILREDAVKRVLQFFGGKSRWMKENEEEFLVKAMSDKKRFYEEVVAELASIRNSSFHYTATEKISRSEKGIIVQIFKEEFSQVGSLLRKKYYSNNVLMFYPKTEIDRLMNELYHAPKERPAQVPAFERILKRSGFGAFVSGNLEEMGFLTDEGKKAISNMNQEDGEKFRSSLYFLLKEIYYYGFLSYGNLEEDFLENVRQYTKETRKNPLAAASFQKRIEEITEGPAIGFGKICQQIMTDYNRQNQEENKVRLRRADRQADGAGDKRHYVHFPMILHQCIKNTFCQYLKKYCNEKKEAVYAFLKTPSDRKSQMQEWTEKAFCQGWETNLYHLTLYSNKTLDAQSGQLSWYIMAHFLNQRQLNQMIGTVKSHIQFLEDISKREKIVRKSRKYTGAEETAQDIETRNSVKSYKKIVEILEFSMLFCEKVSNQFRDYFSCEGEDEAEEEYAKHLSRYLKFESKKVNGYRALQEFCQRQASDRTGTEKTIGIYHDAKNPIPDKRIIQSMMYGNDLLLENCVKQITEQEIQEYYKLRSELDEVFLKNKCETKEEQRKKREFDNRKNRIQLTNLVFYMEIIEELMGQLISWAYLRERDLMYFQLGYYYTKIFYGSSIEPENTRRRLKRKPEAEETEGMDILIADGAILYQIVAMNTYHLPIYLIDEAGFAQPCESKGSIGSKVGLYVKAYDLNTYYAGRQLFERKNGERALDREHDEIIEFRKYIDHFKYFARLDRSMLDLFSVMFDNFFSYNTKLHRNVPVVLENILARHFVIAPIDIGTKEMCGFKNVTERKRARIALKDGKLYSGAFTYHIEGKKNPLLLDARGEVFLEELKRILEYSKEVK